MTAATSRSVKVSTSPPYMTHRRSPPVYSPPSDNDPSQYPWSGKDLPQPTKRDLDTATTNVPEGANMVRMNDGKGHDRNNSVDSEGGSSKSDEGEGGIIIGKSRPSPLTDQFPTFQRADNRHNGAPSPLTPSRPHNTPKKQSSRPPAAHPSSISVLSSASSTYSSLFSNPNLGLRRASKSATSLPQLSVDLDASSSSDKRQHQRNKSLSNQPQPSSSSASPSSSSRNGGGKRTDNFIQAEFAPPVPSIPEHAELLALLHKYDRSRVVSLPSKSYSSLTTHSAHTTPVSKPTKKEGRLTPQGVGTRSLPGSPDAVAEGRGGGWAWGNWAFKLTPKFKRVEDISSAYRTQAEGDDVEVEEEREEDDEDETTEGESVNGEVIWVDREHSHSVISKGKHKSESMREHEEEEEILKSPEGRLAYTISKPSTPPILRMHSQPPVPLPNQITPLSPGLTPSTSTVLKPVHPQSPLSVTASSPKIPPTSNPNPSSSAVSTSKPAPNASAQENKPKRRAFESPSLKPLPPMDAALLQAELNSTFTKKMKCSVCGKEGVNFPSCRRCNGVFCGRACRVGKDGGGDGEKHICGLWQARTLLQVPQPPPKQKKQSKSDPTSPLLAPLSSINKDLRRVGVDEQGRKVGIGVREILSQ